MLYSPRADAILFLENLENLIFSAGLFMISLYLGERISRELLAPPRT